MREERKSGSERGEIEWGKREEGGKEWRGEGESGRGREKERRERKREGGGNGREREVKGCFFFTF